MIDVKTETTYVANPIRMLLLGVLGIGMTALSFAVAWPLLPDGSPAAAPQAVAWFGVAFFGLCTVLIFSRAFGKGRPTLTMSPRGFSFNGVSSEIIPWRDVTNVGHWKMQGTRMIVVGVTEDVWRSPHITRSARWSRSANKALGADGLAIPSTGMPVSFEEMLSTFLAYAQAYMGR